MMQKKNLYVWLLYPLFYVAERHLLSAATAYCRSDSVRRTWDQWMDRQIKESGIIGGALRECICYWTDSDYS